MHDRFDPAVRILAYAPAWARLAEDELERIEASLEDVVVRAEHIGSTAVPGLAAKPIIDLLLGVERLEPAVFAAPLEALGYLYAYADRTRHFFARPRERPRSFHVHVVTAGGDEERRHLAVRDFLRAHPDEARAYGEHKAAVAARHPQDRLAYMDGKNAFVQALEARALRWASSP